MPGVRCACVRHKPGLARTQTPPAAAPRIQCARRVEPRLPPAVSTRPTDPTRRARVASRGAPRRASSASASTVTPPDACAAGWG
eukprot:scaffold2310_cov53-Phaeocystis_antarctica.AAC.3